MGLIINPYMVAADASVTPPFDDYGNPTAGYSMRKLDSSYSGSAIRVREDSGNTEADIGFDSDGYLDTSALLAHCSSNNGFITTWYDQSGNTYDLTQTNTSYQPQIVNSGVLVETNGKASILFDGSDDYLQLSDAGSNALGNGSTTEVNHYSVQSIAAATGCMISSKVGTWEEYFITHASSTNPSSVNAGTLVYYKNGSDISTYTQATVYAAFNIASQTLATITGLNMQHFKSAGSAQLKVGGPYIEMNMNMQELLFWKVSNLPTQADVETNINSYFSIY